MRLSKAAVHHRLRRLVEIAEEAEEYAEARVPAAAGAHLA